MTAYYIDFDGGDDGHDGLTAANAWKTLEKYTQEARVSGDIAYVRRAKTQVCTQFIYLLSVGGPDYIYVKADDGTGWPGEEGGARPCLDFDEKAYFLMPMTGRTHWWIEGLELKDTIGTGTNPALFSAGAGCHHIVLKNCLLHGVASPANAGVLANAAMVKLIDCELYDCRLTGFSVVSGSVGIVEGTIFNKGAGIGTEEGMIVNGRADIKDSTFGATTHHTIADIVLGANLAGIARLRNVTLNSTDALYGVIQSYPETAVYSEDHGQVKGAHKSFYKQGTITKDTGVLHAGGAPSSAKVEPTTFCNVNTPLTLAEDVLKSDFQIWCPASATTITVYIRSFGVWTAYPTASELYIDAEYWDGATAKRVKSTASTQVLADETTWVAFTTTFTPSAAGWAYVRVNLKKYQSAKGIYVDVKPVVS